MKQIFIPVPNNPDDKASHVSFLPEFLKQATAAHSLWEIKSGNGLKGIVDKELFLRIFGVIWGMAQKQVLQQGVVVFQTYSDQDVLHIFFAVGAWIHHALLLRSNLPASVQTVERMTTKMAATFFVDDDNPPFFMFDSVPFCTAFNPVLLQYWQKPSEDTEAALPEMVPLSLQTSAAQNMPHDFGVGLVQF